jgi:hypothetical protein
MKVDRNSVLSYLEATQDTTHSPHRRQVSTSTQRALQRVLQRVLQRQAARSAPRPTLLAGSPRCAGIVLPASGKPLQPTSTGDTRVLMPPNKAHQAQRAGHDCLSAPGSVTPRQQSVGPSEHAELAWPLGHRASPGPTGPSGFRHERGQVRRRPA